MQGLLTVQRQATVDKKTIVLSLQWLETQDAAVFNF